MSSNAHIDAHYNTDNTAANNILQPVTTDKTSLSWDGNAATIAGILHETSKYYKRVGLFQPLLANRAVALSNGKLAIESPSSVGPPIVRTAAHPDGHTRDCRRPARGQQAAATAPVVEGRYPTHALSVLVALDEVY